MSKHINNLEFENITIEEAKNRISNYPFCIVHMISEFRYGSTENITVNWEELLELRAFSDQGELRVYRGEYELKAQCCKEIADSSEDVVELTYQMRDGKKLAVKEYLEPDEDGQAVVMYTRPVAMV